MTGSVAVVILAGGEGSRIGGDKPLRELNGERLIDRALRQASRWSKIVAISVRSPVQVGAVDSPLILDAPGVEGPLAGLVAGLGFGRSEQCEFLMTIAADMPILPADLLQRLSAAIGGSACAVASSGGHLHPVCALWRTKAENEVARYLATGRRSLKGFAEAIGFQAVEWEAEPVDAFFNINTKADLARAVRF